MTDKPEQLQDTGPSKSQLKREMSALQDLGEKLITMNPSLLAKCDLPQNLLEAIGEYQRIPTAKHGALKRQLQYIDKVMRDVPEEVIQQINQQLLQHDLKEKKYFHMLETMREQLLSGDNDSLTELVTRFPEIEIQQIRNLIRNARREAERNMPAESSRKLFRLLRDLHQDQ